ncbi:MAG: DUF2279 domain-containing protein [Bacteroidota bacterium]
MQRSLIYLIILFIFIAHNESSAQSFYEKSDTLNVKRRNFVVGSTIGVGSLTVSGLYQLWYKDYPQSDFHFINDNQAWLYMDKFGHATTAYWFGSMGMKSFRWSGMSERNAIWWGGSVGLIFLTTVEIFDGFSEQWGASAGDVVANISGTALLIGQELIWNEQRVELKFSYSPSPYADQSPELLGKTPVQSIIKDYNGQTYWLSVNPWSFAKESSFPKWLSVSMGYGAEGMLSGSKEIPEGSYSKFLLSLDLKLSNINTGSRFWNTFFDAINVIKVPFPALEYNTKGNFELHPIYF